MLMCCLGVHASRKVVAVPCLKADVGFDEICIQWLLQSLVNPLFHRAVKAVHAHHGFNWEALSTILFMLQRPLAQTCPSRCFTSDENTQTVCCQAAKPAKKLCVCDKSVPQSQSSHSHTAFTNVDLRAQTRKTAQSKNALVRRHAVLVLISCKMSLWGSLKQNVPSQIGCFFRRALLCQ